MKTTLLAAAALSLLACSAETAGISATSEAAVTAPATDVVTVPVTIDVTQELTEKRCEILKGSWITVRFQYHDFIAYGADDIVTCDEKLSALAATPVQRGTMTSERHDGVTVLTLELGGFSFTSRLPNQFDALIVTQTRDVTATFTNPRCEVRKGFSILHADFDGATFDQALPFDGCNDAAIAELLAGNHTGTRELQTYERHTWQMLTLDGGAWTLTSDSRD